MMLETPTFDYVVKAENGESIGTYTSKTEPPMKGETIDLSKLPPWQTAEVLGVTMTLTDQGNTVIMTVRPVETPPITSRFEP